MTELKLTYEERNAFTVMRKAIQRKPELAAALLEGLSKQVAVSVLQQAAKELDTLLKVSQAFSAAAKTLVSLDTPKEPSC